MPGDSDVPSNSPKHSKVKIESDGTDSQVSTTLQKIHAKLRDPKELFKLHLKHYHMSTSNFRKRTSALQVPKDIYEAYDEIVRGCISCQKHSQGPTRSKVTGMRATAFGDLWFVDHVDIPVDQFMYCVLVIVDAATNFIWAATQRSKSHAETISTMEQSFIDLHCRPKAVCADSYFMEGDFLKFYQYNNVRTIPLGPHTPWPNRAEAGVKLTKHHVQILIDSLKRYDKEFPQMKSVSVRHIVGQACWARNISVTYGGRTPAELALGRRPPDILGTDNMMPNQLAVEPTKTQTMSEIIQREALKAHMEARQRTDIRRDLVSKLRPSDGPFEPGQSIWYWNRDLSKIRGGEWQPSRVLAYTKPPMVTIELNGQSTRVNQSKIRKNPDNWHDVVIPGLAGRDGTVTVPGIEDVASRPKQRLRTKTKPSDFNKTAKKPIPKARPNPSTPILVDSTNSPDFDSPGSPPEYDPDNPFDDPVDVQREEEDEHQRRVLEMLREDEELFGIDSDEDVNYVDLLEGITAPVFCADIRADSFRQYFSFVQCWTCS
jgi:hypothetical protein